MNQKIDQRLKLTLRQLEVFAAVARGGTTRAAADEISRDVRLSDEALGLLLDHYGKRQTTELIFCISYFNMLSRFLESTRVPLEDFDPVQRWVDQQGGV